ncbi:IclR family transcriptional regulator [Solicola gregarius]|uniref:Glycerol operon regulatory protein n=1 Tax=Solicola gregarius TaxID=2908642 RepID=A0AA46TDY3_9ACTN|nr:IclR family transcriptional regulator [Solicola gregarius]UYM03320.1 IclR family transcriptional regulator [Solicola gregarius]
MSEAESPSREGRVAGAQTITRALEVLDLLRGSNRDVGLTEIARTLSLHTSTAHRILRALASAGYVAQRADSGRYRLGRASFLLGRAAERDLGFDAVAPVLEQLRDETGESVNLVVRDGDRGLVVLRYESPQPLRFTQPTGTRIPLHCTSTGKVLLAFADDPKAELAALGKLEELTSSTITSRAALTRELDQVRKTGYGTNLGERMSGVCGVAAPVRAGDGSLLAALAVQGPQVRMPQNRLDELSTSVIEAATTVSEMLPHGYQI